ncbi:MAG: hypothetical protein JW909_10405 [Planctomycetes bacterium]|nr:hypothetical protein [Planctomycetota bacterium]
MGFAYIAIVLAAWTVIPFTYRVVEKRGANRFFMASGMGLTALILTIGYALVSRTSPADAAPSQFIIGLILGCAQVALMPIFLAAVARGDLSVTWTVLTLSFSLASLLSMIYPDGAPSPTGFAGLACAAVAILFIGIDTRRRAAAAGTTSGIRKGWGFFITLSFLLNSLNLYLFSLAAHFAPDTGLGHKTAFLAASSAAMFAGSLLLGLFLRRPEPAGTGFKIGLIAGNCSFLGWLFSLLALSNAGIPGYVLYPATTGGSNILVIAISVIFLRERPGRWGWLGIAAGICSFILLGLAASQSSVPQ